MIKLKKSSSLQNELLTASRKIFVGNASTHIHEFFELEYIISGSGTCVIDGCEYKMSAGSLFLLSPVNTHAVYASSAQLINVMFKYEYSSEFTALPLLHSCPSPHFSLNGEDSAFVLSLLSELVDVHKKDVKYARMLLQCVLQKLTHFVESKDNEPSLPYVSRALLYITENFRQSITLADTARHLGLTPTYFSQIFSREMGISFKRYLDDLRFSYAKELLGFTDLPIRDVLSLSGFSDYANFARRFKRLYGMTPSEYRAKKSSYNKT